MVENPSFKVTKGYMFCFVERESYKLFLSTHNKNDFAIEIYQSSATQPTFSRLVKCFKSQKIIIKNIENQLAVF